MSTKIRSNAPQTDDYSAANPRRTSMNNAPELRMPDYDYGRTLFRVAFALDRDFEHEHIDRHSPLVADFGRGTYDPDQWARTYLDSFLRRVDPSGWRTLAMPPQCAAYYAALRCMLEIERTPTGRARSLRWDDRLVRAVADAATAAGGIDALARDGCRDDVPIGPVVAEFLAGFAAHLGATVRLPADFSNRIGASRIGEAAES